MRPVPRGTSIGRPPVDHGVPRDVQWTSAARRGTADPRPWDRPVVVTLRSEEPIRYSILIPTETHDRKIGHRVIAVVRSMNEVMQVEVPGRAATRADAGEVIAVEHLATYRSGDRRCKPGELVALEVTDVLGIADRRLPRSSACTRHSSRTRKLSDPRRGSCTTRRSRSPRTSIPVKRVVRKSSVSVRSAFADRSRRSRRAHRTALHRACAACAGTRRTAPSPTRTAPDPAHHR